MRWTLLLLGLLALAGCGGSDSKTVIDGELINPANFRPVGTARLSEDGDKTRVELTVRSGKHAAPAVRAGLCPELRPREYELTPVEAGRSVTELDVPIEELRAREMKVTLSKSEATPHSIAACAQLPFEGAEAPFALADLARGGRDTGLAWFEEVGGKTRIGILLYAVVAGPEPVTLRRGGCDGDVQQELTPLRQSESVSTVDAPLAEVADGQHAIVAGRSCAAEVASG
jgi:hypothetical protein